MSEGGAPSRPMPYPYTYTAKIAQFPFKFHMGLNWYFKYYVIAFGVCLPVFFKINSLVNSPENKKKTLETRMKDLKEQEEHKKHLK